MIISYASLLKFWWLDSNWTNKFLTTSTIVRKQAFLLMFPSLLGLLDCDHFTNFHWFLKPFIVCDRLTFPWNFWFASFFVMDFAGEFCCHPGFHFVDTIIPRYNISTSWAVDLGHSKVVELRNKFASFPFYFFTIFISSPDLKMQKN